MTQNERPDLDDTPPILGSWRNIYLLLMLTFVLLVVLFTWLTKVYSS